ncbi:type ISP restriction/modification enzyme [Brevibacterium sp. RIT 803]|uniref:DEAD/DEAH box helicase n=1 Tax=Brevibacterium sp. RIT 803 TaxID=2810210 RepID=UPI00195042F1|nr:type ISP restriction/modification enzyme [Brevibacterium sp. RIT 803]MBM6588948.1 DEAD/DEAH box helicase [Brevibacterium sp. RIT 803]
MAMSIRDLLEDLNSFSLDKRDKGDRFERLIKAYLSNEPEWNARFENVWLWPEWPGRGKRTDTGIDIVAERRDGQGLAAIQCKFYAPGQKVPKSEIDKFISSSAGHQWTERYIFDTAAGWTGNAEETLEGVAQRIDIGILDDARVDWSKYSWSKPDDVELATAHQPRRHQKAAIDDVRQGLAEHDRGKMIMACGTGKTFTSLKIAEEQVGEGGTMLFMVPSLQLLSQSLREWMAQSEVDIRPFAVCSDVRVGRKVDDSGDLSTIDLTEPATTDPQKLVERMKSGRHAKPRMTVVFSTYQSIDVISQAQQLGLGDFDLVICDEAHRTTGVTLAGQDESHFVKVHDNNFIRSSKRLYMTATPRVFDDAVTKKAIENDAVLADMNDESTFGPELHRLGFGQAVEQNLLTDYKVIVLTIDEQYVASHFQATMAEDGEIQLGDAAKLLGCWQGLAKNYHRGEADIVEAPMHRAVAFAKDIRASKTATRAFPALVERALTDESRTIPHDLHVQSRHVDGTMSIRQRNEDLDWLKESAEENVCRVLTNARCLSEGVDVPALDAVMFLTPRGSQVDVVQSVGRVMRKDPAGVKQQGYIILPVVVPSDMKPSEALSDNKRYRVVWQVLQALRSHDDRFHAMVNQIDLNSRKNTKIDIVDGTPPPVGNGDGDGSGDGLDTPGALNEQLSFDFGFESFRDGMYARIVKKVGERTYWEDWASDVAEIAERHITRITGLLRSSAQARERFETFLCGLRGNLNESISEDQAIEMLAQHLITRPVFEALFAGYDFETHNPVAQTMEGMLAFLDEHALESENATLEGFYDSVRRRVAGVDNAEGRQKILVDLYNNFFAKAFKKTVDKLGIVYTPVEIVDFILRSADEVLRAEFDQSLSDEGVHILDGFTGTGTFIVRLLQLGLIDPHDLARKYAEEIHANEILLLAYYIAAVNIETTYADVAAEQGLGPGPFPGLVLTDTFQSYEDGDRQDLDVFPENNERIARQRELPITVIVGNPPYSHKQSSGNDDNANESYPLLEAEIRNTYGKRSTAKNKNALYDSYIRAIKWASLRIAERGMIAFVTSNGWLDGNTADGMRLSLADEFSAIYVFNLRGDQNVSNWRAEGGKVFGEGSKSGIAVTVLVKNTNAPGLARIYYEQVDDGLTREQKLEHVIRTNSILSMDSRSIHPNQHGDWISHRTDRFGTYLPIYNEAHTGIFGALVNGVGTSRDAWVYSSGTDSLKRSMEIACSTYTEAIEGIVSRDPKKIKWSSSLENTFKRRSPLKFDDSTPYVAMYRPFEKQRLYPDFSWIHRPRTVREFFPRADIHNLSIYITPAASSKPFSAFMTPSVPDLNLYGSESGQALMRYQYEPIDATNRPLEFDTSNDEISAPGSYRRIDNITDFMWEKFRAKYPEQQISKDDIFFYVYGLLHSPVYREEYAVDLKKSLPRIPMVSGFRSFTDAGCALSELHLDFESVEPFPLEGLDTHPAAGVDPYAFYSVGDKRMKFGKPTADQKASGEKKDFSTIRYNDRITVSGIPEEAYRYQLGSRSAIEWIIDRYHIKTDKPSGIVNDPNDWSREVGDPRYILDLLARVVTVSVETMKIVDALPALDIINTNSDED